MNLTAALKILLACYCCTNAMGSNITTTTGPPFVLNPYYIPVVSNRGNIIDWIIGLFGFGSPPDESEQIVDPPKFCPKCTCGLAFQNKRIVGGIETTKNHYPWMVALTYNNRFYCGASVINNKYLLTAGHCISGFPKERIGAVFLDHDRSNQFETHIFKRSVNKILRHKLYNSGGAYNNDVALIKLDRELPITESSLLKPVCLPPIGKSYTGHTGVAVGWGATNSHGQVSNVLREVNVPIISNTECKKTGYANRITDNMMCAGYPQGTKDSCQGDSGGPLHVIENTIHYLVGIVSWGEGCAQANYPGVYARVNRYITWINSNTRDACYC